MKFLIQHLEDSQTTYFEHLKFAVYASLQLLIAAIASIIHAFFPFMFKGTAAFIVIKLYNQRLINHPNKNYQKWIHDRNHTRHN